MSTHANDFTISKINHRVSSGGKFWKQIQLTGMNGKYWYLVSDARAPELGAARWLIPNTVLSALIGVSPDTTAKRKSIAHNKDKSVSFYEFHADAPTHFVEQGPRATNCTGQLMWTLEGVAFLVNSSGIKIKPEIKDAVNHWLKSQNVVYGTVAPLLAQMELEINDAGNSTVSQVQPSSIACIKSIDEAKKNIVEAVRYVTDLVDQLWIETGRRKELEAEVATLKVKIAEFAGTASKAPTNTAVAKGTRLVVPLNLAVTDAKLRTLAAKTSATTGIKLSKNESLSQYVSRKGNKHMKAETLTRMGLLNSDQVFSLFSDYWTDPSTGNLVPKHIFQDILRSVFQNQHTSHRTPILKADAVKKNLACVCQVICKKKPNPTDDHGNKLELDNPAYESSAEPCVRFQVRYSSAGIEYLRSNWYQFVSAALKPATVKA